MMRKVLDYDIPYIDKGKKKYYPVRIEYVMNYVYKENGKMFEVRKKTQEYADRIGKIQEEGRTATAERLEELNDELLKITNYLEGQTNFFERQFNLINSVLIDNGIENEVVNTLEFWEKKVEPGEIIAFLNAIIEKDTVSKGGGQAKKLMS